MGRRLASRSGSGHVVLSDPNGDPSREGEASASRPHTKTTHHKEARSTDLTNTTGLRPDVVVDFTDPDGIQYLYASHGAGPGWDDDEESATVRWPT